MFLEYKIWILFFLFWEECKIWIRLFYLILLPWANLNNMSYWFYSSFFSLWFDIWNLVYSAKVLGHAKLMNPLLCNEILETFLICSILRTCIIWFWIDNLVGMKLCDEDYVYLFFVYNFMYTELLIFLHHSYHTEIKKKK